MSEAEATRGAQTVFRAVSILETFRNDRPTLTLAEISEAVELTGPTAHRLLRALQAHELVVFDTPTRTYSLGPGVMRLASVVLNREDVLAITQPGLRVLRETTGETVALHWRVDAHRVCLIEYVSNQPIRMASGVGNSYPLVAGASGKAILSSLASGDLDQVIEKAKEAGERVNRKSLLAELAEIRKVGYATSRGETVPGAAALAAPIMDSTGRAIAALNITGPADRFGKAEIEAAIPQLHDAASRIMQQLGYHGPAS